MEKAACGLNMKKGHMKQGLWWIWQVFTAAIALYAVVEALDVFEITWVEDMMGQAKVLGEAWRNVQRETMTLDSAPVLRYVSGKVIGENNSLSVPMMQYVVSNNSFYPTDGNGVNMEFIADANHVDENTGATAEEEGIPQFSEDRVPGANNPTETTTDGAGIVKNEETDVKQTTSSTFVLPAIAGKTYTPGELSYQFLKKNFYNISGTMVYESELNGTKLMGIDLTLKEIKKEPQILIYHTHAHEFFTDSDTSDVNTGIVGAGNYLTELLEGYGYSVLHLTDSFDYRNGKLDRSKAYDYAASRLKEVLKEYPSIEVMIDLHRDGVSDDLRLVTEVNGKKTAKIMFFNGMCRNTSGNIAYLPNANLQENLAFSLQMKVKAEAYYPGFTRKNYVKAYRYNLQFMGRSTLIEAGAQTNTLQEVKNAMEPLAVLLHIQLSGVDE